MKRLTCEMCGSTDLMKQDGVFICQVCGCKYSVEEAKKLMIEDAVQITSTVVIDREKETENLLIIARRYYESGQYKMAVKQYNDVLKNEPNNVEAAFFSVLLDAIDCKIGEIIYSAGVVTNSMDSCTKLVNQMQDIKSKEEFVDIMVNSVIAADKVFEKNAYGYINSCGKSLRVMAEGQEMLTASMNMLIELADCLINNVSYTNGIYESAIKCYEIVLDKIVDKSKSKYKEKIDELRNVISENEKTIAQKKKEDEFNALSKEEQNELIYQQAKAKYNSKDVEQVKDAHSMFIKLGNYNDSREYVKKCNDKIDELPNLLEYDIACSGLESNEISVLEDAISRFEKIVNYKDSSEKLEECKEKLEQLKQRKEQQILKYQKIEEEKQIVSQKANKKKIVKIIAIIIPILLILIAGFYISHNKAVEVQQSLIGKSFEYSNIAKDMGGYTREQKIKITFVDDKSVKIEESYDYDSFRKDYWENRENESHDGNYDYTISCIISSVSIKVDGGHYTEFHLTSDNGQYQLKCEKYSDTVYYFSEV